MGRKTKRRTKLDLGHMSVRPTGFLHTDVEVEPLKKDIKPRRKRVRVENPWKGLDLSNGMRSALVITGLATYREVGLTPKDFEPKPPKKKSG